MMKKNIFKKIKYVYENIKIFLLLSLVFPIAVMLTVLDFLYLFSFGKWIVKKILLMYRFIAIYFYSKAESKE